MVKIDENPLIFHSGSSVFFSVEVITLFASRIGRWDNMPG